MEINNIKYIYKRMTILTRPELHDYLVNLRPASAPKTIQGKVSALFVLYRVKHGDSLTIDTDWFKNYDEVIEAVNTKSDASRSSYLNAVAFLNNQERLPKGQMLDDPVHRELREANKKNQDQAESGEMSKKQKDNWVPYNKVVELWNRLFDESKELFAKPELKKMDIRDLNEFMALTLTCGVFFPPRRSEWVEVKIKDYDPETDNYLDMAHNRFVMNKHKEVRIYGKQTVDFPEEFRDILLKYIERTKMRKEMTEAQQVYLITNGEGGKLTESSLSNMLNRVFGKKISTTMLRHIYKSYQYEMMPSLKQMRSDAEKMGHGLIVSLQYAKKM